VGDRSCREGKENSPDEDAVGGCGAKGEAKLAVLDGDGEPWDGLGRGVRVKSGGCEEEVATDEVAGLGAVGTKG